jgi:hypothetical protein
MKHKRGEAKGSHRGRKERQEERVESDFNLTGNVAFGFFLLWGMGSIRRVGQ